jgi:hypothetical protein
VSEVLDLVAPSAAILISLVIASDPRIRHRLIWLCAGALLAVGSFALADSSPWTLRLLTLSFWICAILVLRRSSELSSEEERQRFDLEAIERLHEKVLATAENVLPEQEWKPSCR